MGSVFALYEVYFSILSLLDSKDNFAFAFGSLVSNIFFVIIIFASISACSLSTRDCDKMMKIIEEKIQKIRNKKDLKGLKIFVMQMKHMKMKFGCGLCDFDWKAIYGVRD
jgi:hypothetical protein